MKKSMQLVILATILSLGFISCGKKVENSDEYVKLVKTVKVLEVSGSKSQHFSGIIEEGKQMNLSFRVGGPIQKIWVKEGDFVQKNQVIAQMDSRDYLTQKNAIEAQVIQLRAEYARVNELNARGSAADNDFEKMKAGVTMAEVKLKNAIDQLNDTKLRAPYSGYISKLNFKEGEMVNIGMPIGSIINVNALKVEINVPAGLFIRKDRIKSITCTQDDLPGLSFPLSLDGYNNKANNNGLYKFYLNYIPEQKSKLIPGMNVKVHITSASNDTLSVKIPLETIFEKNGESYVWVVTDSVVNSKRIEVTGSISNGWIGVKSGVNPGDELVTGGLPLLHEGEKVRIVPPVSKTNIGNQL